MKLVREYIEQFTRGENPLKTLKVGKKAVIENWFKIWAPDAKYEIDDNLNIKTNNSLWFQETKIISLPDNLHVEGWLDLRGVKITSLPDNLHVEGSLYIRNTKITFLPNNLHVDNNLFMRGTKITSLPDNLHVGRNIYKDF